MMSSKQGAPGGAMTVTDAVRLGAEAQRLGRSDVSAEIYRQILKADPNHADVMHLLGLLEMDRGELGAAEPLLRRAHMAHPEIPAFRASYGLALAFGGDVEAGLTAAAQALAAEPGDLRLREVMGQILRAETAHTALLGDPLPLQMREAISRDRPVGTLVLGLAIGYHADDIAPFVRSLRQHYDGPAHLYCDCGPGIAALLERHKITWTEAMVPPQSDPAIWRYRLYEEHLKSVSVDTQILLSDVADVIFQDDPFGFSVADSCVGFLEDPSMTIGTCPWNRDWMAACFAPGVAMVLADREISCIGTLLGDRDGLAGYLNLFRFLSTTLPVPPRYGLDQAIHNVILHFGLIADMVAVENGWPVATIQQMPASAVGVDAAGIVRLADGRAPVIVHQYNRRTDMRDAARRLYG